MVNTLHHIPTRTLLVIVAITGTVANHMVLGAKTPPDMNERPNNTIHIVSVVTNPPNGTDLVERIIMGDEQEPTPPIIAINIAPLKCPNSRYVTEKMTAAITIAKEIPTTFWAKV
jgi:hypothetical protein